MTELVTAGGKYIFDVFKSITPGQTVKEIETVIVKEMSVQQLPRFFVRVAGLSGASAVVLGAYGAHAFNETAEPKMKIVYETGSKYHYIHTIALLASPMCRRPILVGSLLSVGTLLFSGSCYYHALTGNTKVRKVTPYGGVILILAWLAMVL
ncbi:transmembrane protein 256 homolog [Lineus longissimus]|uniref:transmembrane protein 256 homolog n=1 Tax=Lineus longissimus TaxID=88925 RepID=UPI002B4F3A08